MPLARIVSKIREIPCSIYSTAQQYSVVAMVIIILTQPYKHLSVNAVKYNSMYLMIIEVVVSQNQVHFLGVQAKLPMLQKILSLYWAVRKIFYSMT